MGSLKMDEFIYETKEQNAWAPDSSQRNFESKNLIEADQEFAQVINEIPDKLAFKIGEAAKLVGVKTYVLRYWETEFSALKPKKSKNNQRVYSRRDVELAMIIKKLLHKDRFSIEGARSALSKMKKETKKSKAIHGAINKMDSLRSRLQELIFEIEKIQNRL